MLLARFPLLPLCRSRLHNLLALAASVAVGFGLGEAATVQQLVEECKCGEGQDSEDEEQEDDEAGDVPAVMERINLLHQCSTTAGYTHTDLQRGRDGGIEWEKD